MKHTTYVIIHKNLKELINDYYDKSHSTKEDSFSCTTETCMNMSPIIDRSGIRNYQIVIELFPMQNKVIISNIKNEQRNY